MNTMEKFDHILIANRGEIASRICSTAKKMHLKVTAVYSSWEGNALHTRNADFKVELTGSSVAQTYLDIDQIIAAAKKTGANAIHPGYGFLSENAEFAKRCRLEGIVFIGPNPDSIEVMGNKAKAKIRLADANVPMTPGYEDSTKQSNQDLVHAAKSLTFPILVKAAAGGGGRGMRLVESIDQLEGTLDSAKSEALNAFGSGELILEQFIANARHVEVQIIADTHSNVICLAERDCSLQRRHQKVMEEAPAPFLSEQQRQTLHESSMNIVKAIKYVNAGTIEYLLSEQGDIYFIEMNTRLQVEHPVTELIFDIDLVELQIDVAQGKNLNNKPAPVLKGHAIEARLYAENVEKNYMPSVGSLDIWQPASTALARTDSGVEAGSRVTPHFDPMIAKVIAWGEDRTQASKNLAKALSQTHIAGVENNKNFLSQCVSHPAFIAGDISTGFLTKYFDELTPPMLEFSYAIASAVHAKARQLQINNSTHLPDELLGWSSSLSNYTHFVYHINETESIKSNVVNQSINQYLWEKLLDDETAVAYSQNIEFASFSENHFDLNIDGQVVAGFYQYIDEANIFVHARQIGKIYTNQAFIVVGNQEEIPATTIVAPLHGKLIDISVSVGDRISAGQQLGTIESMKMEHSIASSIDGKIASIHAQSSAQVASGDILFELENNDP